MKAIAAIVVNPWVVQGLSPTWCTPRFVQIRYYRQNLWSCHQTCCHLGMVSPRGVTDGEGRRQDDLSSKNVNSQLQLIDFSGLSQSEDDDRVREKSPLSFLARRLLQTASKTIATLLTMFLMLGTDLTEQGNNLFLPTESSATAVPGGMKCVMKKCRTSLAQCLADSTCARGLSCFVKCAAGGSNNQQEGDCQVRCTDLYENDLLDDFTECTITKHSCYPALSEDVRYPSLPAHLWNDDSYQHVEELLRGRWYIIAGLNPAFDTFDCQVHDFFAPATNDIVADATFSYRIHKTDKTFFTKQGDKRLKLEDPSRVILSKCQFLPGKRWGIDSFQNNNPRFHNDNSPQNELSLILELRPNRMEYQDEWTVLASSPEKYMVVGYRGVNAAWEGYGGLNVYAREPMTLQQLMKSTTEIEDALAKLGLTWDDLIAVDNSSCQP